MTRTDPIDEVGNYREKQRQVELQGQQQPYDDPTATAPFRLSQAAQRRLPPR